MIPPDGRRARSTLDLALLLLVFPAVSSAFRSHDETEGISVKKRHPITSLAARLTAFEESNLDELIGDRLSLLGRTLPNLSERVHGLL